MKELTELELISIEGGDLFLYDIAYLCGKIYQACIDASKDKSPGSNSLLISQKMGGL